MFIQLPATGPPYLSIGLLCPPPPLLSTIIDICHYSGWSAQTDSNWAKLALGITLPLNCSKTSKRVLNGGKKGLMIIAGKLFDTDMIFVKKFT